MMSLYSCATHHQSTVKIHRHCIFFLSLQNNIWIPLTFDAVLLELGIKRIHIKMKDEVWNLNSQLLYAIWSAGFLILVYFSELCRQKPKMIHLIFFSYSSLVCLCKWLQSITSSLFKKNTWNDNMKNFHMQF